jgi:predicted DCC family thiol-disulfide oxidoreductase YuxK
MSAPLEVYYDGSCPLCRAEIEALRPAVSDGLLRLHDCSPPDFVDPDALRCGIDRAAMMAAMHVRSADGRWHAGVDAFVVLYRASGIEAISRFWAHPWLKPLWVRTYPWVARNRQVLSRLGVTGLFGLLVRIAARRAARRRCDAGRCAL